MWFVTIFKVMKPKHCLPALLLLGCTYTVSAQLLDAAKPLFTQADSLRGSLNANRTWWNVLRYDIEVEPNYA
jgi:hypothetical protein